VSTLSAGSSTALQVIGETSTTAGSRPLFSNVVHLKAGVSVRKPTTVRLSQPAVGSQFTQPDFIDLRADVSKGDGTVAKVEFFADDKKIGESDREPYQIRWQGAALGNHACKAVATLLQKGETVSSTVLNIRVHPPNAAVMIMSPGNGSTAQHNVRPVLMAGFAGGNKVYLDSFRVFLDGHDFSSQAAAGENDIVFVPKFNLAEGRHNYTVEWQSGGKVIAKDSTTFTVDSVLPDSKATRFFGQVRNMSETPMANVLVRSADRQTMTGLDGRFVFENLPAGEQSFQIDPSAQTTDHRQYAPVTIKADVIEGHVIRREPAIMIDLVSRGDRENGVGTAKPGPISTVPQTALAAVPRAPAFVRPPIAAPKLEPLPATVASWDADTKSADVHDTDREAKFTFAFTNVSEDNLIIQSVRTSCGCTTVQLPALPWTVAAGSQGKISATVNLKGKRGVLTKTLTVATGKGSKVLTVRVNILGTNPKPLPEAERSRNRDIAAADRQAVFKGDCATCHSTPGRGKFGQMLYEADCAICHDSEHRASTVPDLRTLKAPSNGDTWLISIAHGKPNSMMPAFSIADGGPLSDSQIASLAAYLNSRNLPKQVETAPGAK